MKNISISALSTRATGFFSLLSVGFCALTACQQLPQKATVDFVEPKVSAPKFDTNMDIARTTGGLFQKSSYNPAFEDSRARRVGDIVTITFNEKLSAKQQTDSSVKRDTDIGTTITAPPLPGIFGNNLNMSAKTQNNLTGAGQSSADNRFDGSISAAVIEVLPNGHLVVAGEKQIGVNQSVDVMRFSGTINPRMLAINNTIASTQVANVRVESRTRGAQGDAHTVGWLSRFFLSFNPF